MGKINRRHALLFASGVGFSSAVSLIPSEEGAGEIQVLFYQWKASADEDWRHMTDAQMDECCQRHSTLQDQIVTLKPRTAEDLAMQFYVITDSGESEYPDEFMATVKALIGVRAS